MASCSDCSSMGISVVGAGVGGANTDESLETQRRKGLNRLKKKYGLRVRERERREGRGDVHVHVHVHVQCCFDR